MPNQQHQSIEGGGLKEQKKNRKDKYQGITVYTQMNQYIKRLHIMFVKKIHQYINTNLLSDDFQQ